VGGEWKNGKMEKWKNGKMEEWGGGEVENGMIDRLKTIMNVCL